jgi:hypothetical protein
VSLRRPRTAKQMRAYVARATREMARLMRLFDRINARDANRRYWAARRRQWAAEAAPKARKRPRKADRPRCGARTKSGTCQAPARWLAGAAQPVNGRCRRHGGFGPGERKFSAEAMAACFDATRRATAARRAAREAEEPLAAVQPAPASGLR